MQKLHLVGVTTDQQGLIFSSRRGSKSGGFVVPLSEELVEAVTHTRSRHGDGDGGSDRSRPRSILSVREMQARLRVGRSIEEVAREAGVEPAWVAKFAPPVLAEQAQVVADAQAAVYHKRGRGASGASLADAVRRNLADRGVVLIEDEFEDAWSTYQVQDDAWIVFFGYRNRGQFHEAIWDFDRATGTLASRDRLASQLAYIEPGSLPRVRRASSRRPPPQTRSRALTSWSDPGSSAESDDEDDAPRRTSTRRRPAGRKAAARKPGAARKAPAKRTTAKKSAAKKATKKRSLTTRKAPAKRTTAKKSAAKKTTARSTTRARPRTAGRGRAPAKKTSSRTTASRRSTARKSTARKAGPARKTPAKRPTAKSGGSSTRTPRKTSSKQAATKRRATGQGEVRRLRFGSARRAPSAGPSAPQPTRRAAAVERRPATGRVDLPEPAPPPPVSTGPVPPSPKPRPPEESPPRFEPRRPAMPIQRPPGFEPAPAMPSSSDDDDAMETVRVGRPPVFRSGMAEPAAAAEGGPSGERTTGRAAPRGRRLLRSRRSR